MGRTNSFNEEIAYVDPDTIDVQSEGKLWLRNSLRISGRDKGERLLASAGIDRPKSPASRPA